MAQDNQWMGNCMGKIRPRLPYNKRQKWELARMIKGQWTLKVLQKVTGYVPCSTCYSGDLVLVATCEWVAPL